MDEAKWKAVKTTGSWSDLTGFCDFHPASSEGESCISLYCPSCVQAVL